MIVKAPWRLKGKKNWEKLIQNVWQVGQRLSLKEGSQDGASKEEI